MQTDYGNSQAVGVPGMRSDTGRHNEHVVSRVNPLVLIPFGAFVTKGTEDDHVKLPTTALEVTNGEGVALQDNSTEQVANGLAAGYALKSAVSVLRQGRVWVRVEEAVVKGDAAFARWANGNTGNVNNGSFRKSADQVAAADTATLIPSAKYGSSAAAGGLAILEINLP